MSKPVVEALNKVLQASEKLPDDQKLKMVNGVRYPGLIEIETLNLLPQFVTRPDDVLLVTYPKCGCNWVLRLVDQMLKLTHPAVAEAGLSNHHLPLLEFGPPAKLKALDAAPSPRLIATHFSDLIPQGFFKSHSKILVIFREPKDTAVSFYHFYRNNPGLPTIEPWDKFFPMFMKGDVVWGSYFDHLTFWKNRWEDKNVLMMTYEEFKADLSGQLQKMSTFLGLGLSEEQLTTVAASGTFGAMKAKAESENFTFGKVVFRKGEVGDWKNHFTAEQHLQLEAKYAETIAGTTLGARLNY